MCTGRWRLVGLCWMVLGATTGCLLTPKDFDEEPGGPGSDDDVANDDISVDESADDDVIVDGNQGEPGDDVSDDQASDDVSDDDDGGADDDSRGDDRADDDSTGHGGGDDTDDGVDECQTGTATCPADAQCRDLPDRYECLCPADHELVDQMCLAVLCEGDNYDHDQDPDTDCIARTVCEPGMYVESNGSSRQDRNCELCERGTFTDAINLATCTPHQECQPGWRRTVLGTSKLNAECRICLRGYYTDEVNAEACTLCPAGSYTNDEGAANCTTPNQCPWDGPGAADCDPNPVRQFGSFLTESGHAVAAGGGGIVVVVGTTNGVLEQGHELGGEETYVQAYDEAGGWLWTRQFSTPEHVSDVTMDADGRVYFVGSVQDEDGYVDAFFRGLDAQGGLYTSESYGGDAQAIAVGIDVNSSGEIASVGRTTGTMGAQAFGLDDIFVRKSNVNGGYLWVKQFGTEDSEQAAGVVMLDNGNIVVAGNTEGLMGAAAFGNLDGVVMLLDGEGDELWIRQFGTEEFDDVSAVAAVPGGSIYVVGSIRGSGSFGTPSDDDNGFIQAFDKDGTPLWQVLVDSGQHDLVTGVAVDADGNVVVSGVTGGILGDSAGGATDAFAAAYSANGEPLWAQQYGGTAVEQGSDITVGGNGSLFMSGFTEGTLVPEYGVHGVDAFVVHVLPPE